MHCGRRGRGRSGTSRPNGQRGGGRGGRAGGGGGGGGDQYTNFRRDETVVGSGLPRHSAPAQRGGGGDRKRALFTKFMRDDTVTMDRKLDALRFIEGMQASDSLPRVLGEILDERKPGIRRIQEVLSFTETINDITDLLVPLLRCGINTEMDKPLYRGLRLRYLYGIYQTPGLLDFLTSYEDLIINIEKEEADLLCEFFRLVAKAYGEPRNSEQMATMARTLRLRQDVPGVESLCRVLLVEEKREKAEDLMKRTVEVKRKKVAPACWASGDLVPPGGRHDNDFVNYRDIRIVPTPEELMCQEKSYRPLTSGENAHTQDPIQHMLDRNFRLLREDAVEAMRTSMTEPRRVWKNARIIGVEPKNTARDGSVPFIVEVDKPSSSIDWGQARVLMQGSVVALLDKEQKIVRTGIITIRHHEEKGKWMNAPDGPSFGVCFEDHSAFDDCIHEISRNRPFLSNYTKAFRSANTSKAALLLAEMAVYDLIEISTSFFSYRPVLTALQNMETVAFSDELVHQRVPADGRCSYLPPTVRFPDGEHFHGYRCPISQHSIGAVVERTTLDQSQASAVLHALTSRVALIQGPPGTGKTFIGGLIAQVILQNSSEQILCVCYTNHALDLFLEHMIDYGVDRIVRMGGRSRSERVQRYNLRELARQRERGQAHSQRRIKQVDAQMHNVRERIEKSTQSLQAQVQWDHPHGGVKSILRSSYPDILEFFCFLDEDEGSQTVGPKGKQLKDEDLWDRWKDGEEFPSFLLPLTINIYDPDAFHEFWSRPISQRARFVDTLRQSILDDYAPDLHSQLDVLKELAKERELLVQAKDLDTLRRARVIGATTTGAATYRELISELSPGVIVVEEAGEVLEAHVLSALAADPLGGKATKHLVLIGDHKQLRPKVESYGLSEASGLGYDLDISLFERLVVAGQASVTLQVQHRMRPSLSSIIRAQTYPNLIDHGSVAQYPGILGVDATVDGIVFIDHRRLEDGVTVDAAASTRSTTKSNAFEVDLAIEVVRFLLLQGYSPDRITVLTPYVGQLLCLIKAMKGLKDVQAYLGEQDLRDIHDASSSPEGIEIENGQPTSVRLSSIDNFQGEESDIVVVSLVRSNKEGNIGFLAEEQRVNVLLSRARHGMILLGNSETLVRKKSGRDTWEPILAILEAKNQIRDGLPTVCQIHPEDPPIILRQPEEFRSWRPNGGCQRPCKFRLACGHVCPQMCHPLDQQHRYAQSQCSEPCRRIPSACRRGHACSRLCNEPCRNCCFPLIPTELPCGHVATYLQCYEVNSVASLEMIKCREKVTVTLEKCSHEITTTCCNARSPNPVCSLRCGKAMVCGHPCDEECATCDGNHRCERLCDRPLFCGHSCGQKCHADTSNKCGSCIKPCINQCAHSKCPKPCSEPCASCVETCDWVCEHQGGCPLVCAAPCTRLPCNKRCDKKLSCGHQCPSVCGETCPAARYCIKCSRKDNILSRVVDHLEFKTYREYEDQLDEDPIVFLPCGHFYAMSTLDGHMEIHLAYERNPEGSFADVRPLGTLTISEKAKQCPDCRSAIHSVRRYSRITKYGILRSLQRKHMEWMDGRLKLCEERIAKLKSLKQLTSLLQDAKASPFQQVHDASGREGDEPPSSPAGPIIRVLMLIGRAYADRSKNLGDTDFLNARKSFEEVIVYAQSSDSLRSEALARLQISGLLVPWVDHDPSYRGVIEEHLNIILSAAFVSEDVKTKVEEFRRIISEERRRSEMKQILAAMNTTGGYNYGTSASSHWYQCPNGHPYFIGECGGAMQESRCLECGQPVGGTSHTLLRTNTRWSGLSDLR